jgi:hypothetical protein
MRPRLPFGNNNKNIPTDPQIDSTAWLINSGFAEFLLLHTIHIKYMVMFGYTYLNGTNTLYIYIYILTKMLISLLMLSIPPFFLVFPFLNECYINTVILLLFSSSLR